MIYGLRREGECHTLGQAGRLNCMQTWWVLPGDSISINFGGLFRMPNMRKYMWTPVTVDIFCFFTPAAWIYPKFRENLNAHMKDPFAPFTSDTDPFYPHSQHSSNIYDSQFHWIDGSPKYDKFSGSMLALYNYVYNEWFRDINLTPTPFPVDIASSTFFSDAFALLGQDNSSIRNYGVPVCNLPNIFSTFNENSEVVEDYYQTDIVADELDLVELQQQAQTIKSQQEYYHMAQRFRDQLAKKYAGASVSHEADPRPYLMGSNRMQFGGHDVDATGDNIGETQGKSTGRLEFSMPETMFGEHGYLQLYIVPRFRPIYENAKNPITNLHFEHPKELLAVPEYISQQKPVDIALSDFFNSTADGNVIASIPSGEFLRWGYSTAHDRFHQVEAGFPLYDYPVDMHDLIYCRPDDWNRMFVSQALGNYTVQSQFFMNVKSTLPPASASLMAGTNIGA